MGSPFMPSGLAYLHHHLRSQAHCVVNAQADSPKCCSLTGNGLPLQLSHSWVWPTHACVIPASFTVLLRQGVGPDLHPSPATPQATAQPHNREMSGPALLHLCLQEWLTHSPVPTIPLTSPSSVTRASSTALSRLGVGPTLPCGDAAAGKGQA